MILWYVYNGYDVNYREHILEIKIVITWAPKYVLNSSLRTGEHTLC